MRGGCIRRLIGEGVTPVLVKKWNIETRWLGLREPEQNPISEEVHFTHFPRECTPGAPYRTTASAPNIMSVFHLPKKFRIFRLGCNWNTTFWFVPLEIFRNKRNLWKGSPIFPVETCQWKICVPFTDFSSLLFLSPVPYLSQSFKRPGLSLSSIEWKLVTNGTRSSQTEIPNRNFPIFFVNGKRPITRTLFPNALVSWSLVSEKTLPPRQFYQAFKGENEIPGRRSQS